MPPRFAMRRSASPPASRLPSCARSTTTDRKTRCTGRCAFPGLRAASLPRRTSFSRRIATASPCAMCLGFCSATLCRHRTTQTRSSCRKISVTSSQNLCLDLQIPTLTCLRFAAPNDDGSGAYAQGVEDEGMRSSARRSSSSTTPRPSTASVTSTTRMRGCPAARRFGRV